MRMLMMSAMDALLSLGGASGSPVGTTLPPLHPHDPDWLVPLGVILVALFALVCITLYVIFRWGSCKEHTVAMFEHECIVASLTMVLLLVLSMASLYYFYCYRGGCFGAAMAGAAPGTAGRKLKMMNS